MMQTLIRNENQVMEPAAFAEEDACWVLTETAYDPVEETLHATQFAAGNRYLGLRGSFEELGSASVQGCFIAGVFVKMRNYYWPHGDTFFKKKMVFDEEAMKDERRDKSILNVFDPLFVRLWIDGIPFRMYEGRILEYNRTLDLRDGVLRRRVRWDDGTGRVTRFDIERFCAMDDPHRITLRYGFAAENYTAPVRLETGIDTRVATCGHDDLFTAQVSDFDAASGGFMLTQVTCDPQVTIATGVRHRLLADECELSVTWEEVIHRERLFYQQANFTAVAGTAYALEKSIIIHTMNDPEGSAPEARVTVGLAEMMQLTHGQLHRQHRDAWAGLWNAADISIEAPPEVQRSVRFSLFHLLIAAPLSQKASIGAKSLSGEGYKGYVFWDTDVYLAPFYYFTMPDAARNLLAYRYRGLKSAKAIAQAQGLAGARYPWQAADTGEEECWGWLPSGMNQIHIVADVALSALRYGEVTGDRRLLQGKGWEIVFGALRYFASRVDWNAALARYEILNVCGPDEYHPIGDNNAYTNYCVKWLIERAEQAFRALEQQDATLSATLCRRLKIESEEWTEWMEIGAKLYLPFDAESGLIEQLDGFFGLQRHWEQRGAVYGGPSAEYHLCQGQKQPDTLLLLTLFPKQFDRDVQLANWDYYEPTTEHGSSLSASIHATLAAQLGMRYAAEGYMQRALDMDLKNINGDSGGGIHIANCSGVWLALVQGFAGLYYDGHELSIAPCLPLEWKAITVRLLIEGVRYEIRCTARNVTIRMTGEPATQVGSGLRVAYDGQHFKMNHRNELELQRVVCRA